MEVQSMFDKPETYVITEDVITFVPFGPPVEYPEVRPYSAVGSRNVADYWVVALISPWGAIVVHVDPANYLEFKSRMQRFFQVYEENKTHFDEFTTCIVAIWTKPGYTMQFPSQKIYLEYYLRSRGIPATFHLYDKRDDAGGASFLIDAANRAPPYIYIDGRLLGEIAGYNRLRA